MGCCQPDGVSVICAEERLTFVGEDDIEMEMRVPQEAVKLIIGRQGANIKQVSVRGLPADPGVDCSPFSAPHTMYILKIKNGGTFFS